MKSYLAVNNIVLIGSLDISTLDKYFFIKNNILKENEILAGSVFDVVGGLVQIVSNKFNILITIQQIIITATQIEENKNVINDVLLNIVKFAKIINITALGINFHWFMSDDKITLEELSKKLFYNETTKILSSFFNSQDSMFGVYASTNFKDSRLKLDVKPNIIQKLVEKTSENIINFAFNFHFDIKIKTDNSEIIKVLSDYEAYKNESKKIMSIYQ